MSGKYIQANTNGRLHDAREASLSPLNRGFLYGDAVYEVWRTYDEVIFAWEEHWRRLHGSAEALYLNFNWEKSEMLAEIKRTAEAFCRLVSDPGEFYVRLQISRGEGEIGLDPALAERANYVILVQANKDISADKKVEGYRLSLETTLRRNSATSLNPAWKTGNYLNNILGLRAAKSRGADEVLMLNQAGELTEASTSNIGFIRGDKLITPPLKAGLLSGITREIVRREVAARAGLSFCEQTLYPDDIAAMEECFLMSTTRDIAPVGMIDEQQFPVGGSTTTAKLKTAFADYVGRYTKEHPSQKLR